VTQPIYGSLKLLLLLYM